MLTTNSSQIVNGRVEMIVSVDLEQLREQIAAFGYYDVTNGDVQAVVDYIVDMDWSLDNSRDIESACESALGEAWEFSARVRY